MSASAHAQPVAASAAAPLSPVASRDRIASLDLMRGLAVLGVLAVNATAFSMPADVYQTPSLSPFPLDGAAGLAWQVMHVFFEQKFIALLSMLFGASIFLVGGERDDYARGELLKRRLGWLTLFGLIHGALFWFGDILLLYAVTGFLVLMARSWSGRRLLITGVIVWLIFAGGFALLMMSMAYAPPEALESARQSMGAMGEADVQDKIAEYRAGALQATLANFWTWATFTPMMLIAYLAPTAALMLIGMGMFKTGVFKGQAPTWLYASFIVAGAGALYLIWNEASGRLAADFVFPIGLTQPANGVLAPVVSLGYASVLILIWKAGAARLLHPLACAGRMAFTNYLTQTLIMTTIFYGGRGLGYFGQIGWPDLWLIIAGVWVAQLIWSPLWLSRFEMGPMEWVWRSLTYRRRVPLLKARA